MPQPSRSRKRPQVNDQGSGQKAKRISSTAAATPPAKDAPVATDVAPAMLAGVAGNDAPLSAGVTANKPEAAMLPPDQTDLDTEMRLIAEANGTAPDKAEPLVQPPEIAEGKKHKGKKHKKEKVVRDSFTMPRGDYEKIDALKKKIQQLGLSAKKGEVLRAGLHALEQMTPDQLKRVIEGVEKIKTGRPG